jgi:hypothetical protein
MTTVRRLSTQDIKRELEEFEVRYGMTTEEFVRRYRSGELDGTDDHIFWMGLHRMMLASLSKKPAKS